MCKDKGGPLNPPRGKLANTQGQAFASPSEGIIYSSYKISYTILHYCKQNSQLRMNLRGSGIVKYAWAVQGHFLLGRLRG